MGIFKKIFGSKKQNKETHQEFVNAGDINFTTPTISNEFPQITDSEVKANFETYIFEDDWRQNEFLNFSSLPLIEIELKEIKKIWDVKSF